MRLLDKEIDLMRNEQRTICLLNDSFPPIIDGVSNAVLNYAKYIESNYGHAIVVTPEVPGSDDRNYSFPVVRYPSIDTRKLMGYVTGYPFSPEAARILTEKKAELLHLHCPVMSALLAWQLREAMQLPLVLTWHTKYDIDIANAVHSKLLQEEVIKAFISNVNNCDEVWTVSEGAGRNLQSLGFEGDYIVMENGVDLPRGSASDVEMTKACGGYDLPSGVPVFLFVGRLMWYKGLKIILDALAALKHEAVAFRMVFVGGGGDEAEVKSYASSLGLDPVCFFTGPIRDREALRAWYSRADLFLFPSTFDTNGLVVREAAACGTASVLVEGSCAAEGIQDGDTGLLIQENAASLALRLDRLCAAPEQMMRIGENAQTKLYLSWEDAVARASERYEIVIDNYKSGRYVRRRRPQDEFMKTQGYLMKALGELDVVMLDLKDRVQEVLKNIYE